MSDHPASHIRTDYQRDELLEAVAPTDPLDLFSAWFDAAAASGLPEPNAMALATADATGRPSVRTVLLKGFDGSGFVFYTNYQSRKAMDIEANPRAAFCFWWPSLERQVRIEGRVERVSAEESDAYFRSRPRLSQISAAASDQSREVDRDALQRRFEILAATFAGSEIPRPEHWGGYRLIPESIEFWQGRPNRMHDRLEYRREESGQWARRRLAP